MSATRIMLLRAVNVGGATLPMAELRDILTELRATNVRTYIASGNAVCTIDDDPAVFDRALEAAIEHRFGFFREVISRTPEEVIGAFAAYPFEVIDPKICYVNFLLSEPTPEAIAKAQTFPTGADRWEVIGRDQHIRYAVGAGTPQMNVAAIGKALGVAGTARNLGTVQSLIELSGG
jgi:uncharacterized protein (DUF1697 family)